MILTYEAVDASGKRSHDVVEASTTRDAISSLRDQGLFVTQIHEKPGAEAAGRSGTGSTQVGRLPVKVLALVSRQMAMLLRSGSGLVPALSAIRRQITHPKQGALLDMLIADLEEGVTLTEALRKHPQTFDPVYCAIVSAGEASATLPAMFERLSVIVGKRRAMRKKILSALAYPALLITMCATIICVLLLFVLPRFADMFTQLQVDVPSSTEMLLSLGSFLRNYWPGLVGMVALTSASVAWVVLSKAGKQWLANIQTAIPMIGALRSKMIQAQVFRTMGMLIESQVGLLDALDLARKATNNAGYQRLFDNLVDVVTSGGTVSFAFEDSRFVEPYVCQAVRTGEDSGNLGGALTYCADVLEESSTEMVNMIAKLIEPMILIVMGVVVGGVAISLFMPLFDLTSAMG